MAIKLTPLASRPKSNRGNRAKVLPDLDTFVRTNASTLLSPTFTAQPLGDVVDSDGRSFQVPVNSKTAQRDRMRVRSQISAHWERVFGKKTVRPSVIWEGDVPTLAANLDDLSDAERLAKAKAHAGIGAKNAPAKPVAKPKK